MNDLPHTFFFSGQNSHTGPHFCLHDVDEGSVDWCIRLQQCLANRATDTREPCKIPCSFCAYVSESCCCSPSPFVHGGGASVPPVPKMMANLSSPSRALFFTPVVRTETLHHAILTICKTYTLSAVVVLLISLAPFLLLRVHCCRGSSPASARQSCHSRSSCRPGSSVRPSERRTTN